MALFTRVWCKKFSNEISKLSRVILVFVLFSCPSKNLCFFFFLSLFLSLTISPFSITFMRWVILGYSIIIAISFHNSQNHMQQYVCFCVCDSKWMETICAIGNDVRFEIWKRQNILTQYTANVTSLISTWFLYISLLDWNRFLILAFERDFSFWFTYCSFCSLIFKLPHVIDINWKPTNEQYIITKQPFRSKRTKWTNDQIISIAPCIKQI